MPSCSTQFENILVQSFTEQTLYDFKQGVFTLAQRPEFDEEAFGKVVRTLTAIANLGPQAVGYVILGVADKASDAEAVKNIYGVVATKFNRFLITGVEHEAKHKNALDGYFRWLVTLLKNVIFRTLAAKEPVHYDGVLRTARDVRRRGKASRLQQFVFAV